jgi:hypothetical protein
MLVVAFDPDSWRRLELIERRLPTPDVEWTKLKIIGVYKTPRRVGYGIHTISLDDELYSLCVSITALL